MILKPTEEVLLIMLRKQFMRELKEGKVTSGDNITWVLRNKEWLETLFNNWLVTEGYAE